MKYLAVFITPHGYGHATRAIAVMQALEMNHGPFYFYICGNPPEHLLEEAGLRWETLKVACDVGLVQKDSLNFDLEATCAALGGFLPLDAALLSKLCDTLKQAGVKGVLCDISAMGIEVAKRLGVPSFLVENFTWDWIYELYEEQAPDIGGFIEELRFLYDQVDHHIQTTPISARRESSIKVGPIVRPLRGGAKVIRSQLGIGNKPFVLITMGGVAQDYAFLDMLGAQSIFHFLVSGKGTSSRNVSFISEHDAFYHPDLIDAADLVVGKLGYSTVAEILQAGTPYLYIERSNFRESGVLATYMRDNHPSQAISEDAFHDGTWLLALEKHLSDLELKRHRVDGALEVANYVISKLN